MKEATVKTIWDRDGEKSAYQTKVICGHFRIHIFWRGDRDPDMHDHPADFWTFPLVSYVEEYMDEKAGGPFYRKVSAFRLHRRKAEFAHRVVHAAGAAGEDRTRPIVTLVWWGKKRREWGFHTNRGWVDWRTYHGIT